MIGKGFGPGGRRHFELLKLILITATITLLNKRIANNMRIFMSPAVDHHSCNTELENVIVSSIGIAFESNPQITTTCMFTVRFFSIFFTITERKINCIIKASPLAEANPHHYNWAIRTLLDMRT